MTFAHTNFADSELASGISSTASQLTILAADADVFATFTATGGEVQRAVIFDGTQTPELVDISLRADNVLDISRAAESTTAKTWAAGSKVRAGLTAQMMLAAGRTISGDSNISVTGGDGTSGETSLALATMLSNTSASDFDIDGGTHDGITLNQTTRGPVDTTILGLESTGTDTATLDFKSGDLNGTSYELIWPTAPGTTDQVLRITTVSASQVVVEWGTVQPFPGFSNEDEFAAYVAGL